MPEFKTVCVDLDGVLFKKPVEKDYDVNLFGELMPGAQDFLLALSKVARVTIFTTRCSTTDNGGRTPEELHAIIKKQLDTHNLKYDEIFVGQGKPLAAAYVDDRAVECDPTTDQYAFPFALSRVEHLLAH